MNAQLTGSPIELSPDNPWPALQSFDEASQAFFFGMHAETDALFRLGRRETLALFFRRSGFGKPSLLQPGLLSRFRRGNLLHVSLPPGYAPIPPSLLSQVKQ